MSETDRRASEVAAKVLLFLQLLGEEDVKVTSVRESPVLYEVKWQAKKATLGKPDKPGGPKTALAHGKMWVTLDGRYITRRAVDLEGALQGYRKERAFVSCLQRRGARVLLVPGTQGTARQLKILGVFGAELVIWCTKKHRKLCDVHGSAYPRWLWPGGSRPGVIDPKSFESELGCKR